METIAALGFAFLLFLVLALVAYFGMRSTLWSAIVFASMVAAAFLVFYYPPTKLVNAGVTVPLILYFAFVFVAFALVVTYVFVMAILDVRAPRAPCYPGERREVRADCRWAGEGLALPPARPESRASFAPCSQGGQAEIRQFGAPAPETEERRGAAADSATPRAREVRVTVFAG